MKKILSIVVLVVLLLGLCVSVSADNSFMKCADLDFHYWWWENKTTYEPPYYANHQMWIGYVPWAGDTSEGKFRLRIEIDWGGSYGIVDLWMNRDLGQTSASKYFWLPEGKLIKRITATYFGPVDWEDPPYVHGSLCWGVYHW